MLVLYEYRNYLDCRNSIAYRGIRALNRSDGTCTTGRNKNYPKRSTVIVYPAPTIREKTRTFILRQRHESYNINTFNVWNKQKKKKVRKRDEKKINSKRNEITVLLRYNAPQTDDMFVFCETEKRNNNRFDRMYTNKLNTQCKRTIFVQTHRAAVEFADA